MKELNNKKLIGAGAITAIAASLCCITPVLALFAGVSGIASTFSWLEPARPYFIGITVLVLGYSWYQKLRLRSEKEIKCDCNEDEKPSFWQSRKFLSIVTVFAIIMTAFPYYSSIFYPDYKRDVVIVNRSEIKTMYLDIEGMTCEACESHITYAAQQIEGVIEANADHKNGKAKVKFDKSKTKVDDVIKVINSTGYTVKNHKLINK